MTAKKYNVIYADPPWRFQNRSGKVAPEHKRLSRYATMNIGEIMNMPVNEISEYGAHLYLWVPNALIQEGLDVMRAWGFTYKTNIIWHKVRKDGEPDGRGVGFYFRNVTEILLFGIKGKSSRTNQPARSQVNIIKTIKREHSRKPDEVRKLIERCSNPPYLELFAREEYEGWDVYGNEVNNSIELNIK